MIMLSQGSGGSASDRLIREIMLPAFDNPILKQMHDGATIDFGDMKLAFSTDSYVVDPIFFPGGNIGDLAINGTVNDLAMCGANPKFISVGLIIEEGFQASDLKIIVQTMSRAAKNAGVDIVTGDTKVVSRGAADKIFINTSGIGVIPEHVHINTDNIKVGDKIILSGTIGDHGITVLAQRKDLSFDANVSSDSAPLNNMVNKMFISSENIHMLRDPTRGGLGTTLNEIACQSQVGIVIYEKDIPIKKEVAGVCDLLGLDPLYIANEGKLIAVVSEDDVDIVLKTIRGVSEGKDACIIGEVISDYPGQVVMETQIGGKRIIDMLSDEQLPRIC